MVRTGEDGPKGITALVIEKDMKGVSFGANEKKLGWHSQPTAQVNFDEVRVPVANRVGGEGEGFRIADDGARRRAASTSAPARLAGRSAASTRRCNIPRSASSSAPPSPTSRTPSSCWPTWRPSCRRRATALRGGGQGHRQRARQDQVRGNGQAPRHRHRLSVVDRALQLHGGYGYLMDYPIERFWRDLRVHSILEGTNQVMRMIVGRELTRQ
jgi:alkylation response protein AidB-like acyl-CoA dehydrogenase